MSKSLFFSALAKFFLGVILVGVLTAGFGVTFEKWSEDGGQTWHIGQHWHEETITQGIFIGLLIILAAEILSHRLNNRKS